MTPENLNELYMLHTGWEQIIHVYSGCINEPRSTNFLLLSEA